MQLDKNTGLVMPGTAAGASGGEAVDLSFVTADAADIRAGKIGCSAKGSPIYGTLEGGYSQSDIVKNVLLFG